MDRWTQAESTQALVYVMLHPIDTARLLGIDFGEHE